MSWLPPHTCPTGCSDGSFSGRIRKRPHDVALMGRSQAVLSSRLGARNVRCNKGQQMRMAVDILCCCSSHVILCDGCHELISQLSDLRRRVHVGNALEQVLHAHCIDAGNGGAVSSSLGILGGTENHSE